MTQTAVEWLNEQFNNPNIPNSQMLFEQAKAMEKEQIVDAYIDGEDDETNRRVLKMAAEQYYNETYGGDK